MENDVLRSGAIFKLTNKDLERVRSPPLVKFNVPKERSSEKAAPKDQVRETFLEIYRQTPVPQMAGNRRLRGPTTSNTSSQPKSCKADYSSVSSSVRRDDRIINSTIDSDQEKLQKDSIDYEDSYVQDDYEVVVENIEPIVSKSQYSRTSKVDQENALYVSNKTPAEQEETSTKPQKNNDYVVTKSCVADVSHASDKSRSMTTSRGGNTGSSSGSKSRAGGRGSNQTGDSLLMLFGKPSTSAATATVRSNNQSSGVKVNSSISQAKASSSSTDTDTTAPTIAITTATHIPPSYNLQQQQQQQQQQQKVRKESTLIKPNTLLPTHDLLGTSSKQQSTEEVAVVGRQGESLLVKRGRPKANKDNLETSQPPNKQKQRLNKKIVPTTTTDSSDSSEILTRDMVSDTAESGLDSSVLEQRNKHTTGTKKPSTQKPRGRPFGKRNKSKVTADTMNTIEPSSKDVLEKRFNNTTGSGSSEHNSDHSSTDAGRVDKNELSEVQTSTDEAATVTRSGRQSMPRKVIPLLSEAERQSKATERVGQKISAKRGRPSKTATAEGTAEHTTKPTRSVKSKSKTSNNNSEALMKDNAYNLHTAIREVADATGWTPAQKVALYSVQSRIDVRAGNFWELVSDALAELGIEKTATECSAKWFEKVEDARIRKEKKAAEDREKARKKAEAATASMVAMDSTKENSSSSAVMDGTLTGVKSIDEPTKMKRISKVQLKRLAGEAMKATHEDDIFESTGMRNSSYWTDSATDSALTTAITLTQDLLSQEMLLDLNGTEKEVMKTKDNHNTSGLSAGERTEKNEEEAIDFATSHVHKLNYRRPLAYTRTKAAMGRHDNNNDDDDAYISAKQTKIAGAAVTRVEREYHTLQKQHQQENSEEEDDELDSEEEES